MNVTVCVKRVPSTATRLKIAPEAKGIDESGIEFVINPYDEFAVEEALKIIEKAGGELTILTLGPESASKEIRTCLALGATKAVHLVSDDSFRDGLSVARALAEALQSIPSDLILLGRQAVDHDNAQVGLMIATLLGLPAVIDVVKVEISGSEATVEREVEGGARETYRLSLPCLLTAQKGLNEPRLPNLKGIMAAKKKPVAARPIGSFPNSQKLDRIELPAERSGGRIVGKGQDAVSELLRLLREEAKVI